MIQQQTLLKVVDNSGAKIAKCIKVLGGFKQKFAYLGNIIIVSIFQLRNKSKNTSKVQKGAIFQALIVKTRTKTRRKDGSFVFFKNNCVSLINKQGNPIATRIVGPISKSLKKKKFMKFSSISTGFI